MLFKLLSAIYINLDQSKVLSSGNGLILFIYMDCEIKNWMIGINQVGHSQKNTKYTSMIFFTFLRKMSELFCHRVGLWLTLEFSENLHGYKNME